MDNTRSYLLFSEDKLILAHDIEVLMVVQTNQAILVSNKNTSGEKFKELISKVKEWEMKMDLENTCHRPWGHYTVLTKGEGYLTKKIVVYPGKRTSLQTHEYRDEHWIIAKGAGKLVIGEKIRQCKENESYFVRKNQIHRIENNSVSNLEIIEMQYGDDLREDDIKRFEDDYGRVQNPVVLEPK